VTAQRVNLISGFKPQHILVDVQSLNLISVLLSRMLFCIPIYKMPHICGCSVIWLKTPTYLWPSRKSSGLKPLHLFVTDQSWIVTWFKTLPQISACGAEAAYVSDHLS